MSYHPNPSRRTYVPTAARSASAATIRAEQTIAVAAMDDATLVSLLDYFAAVPASGRNLRYRIGSSVAIREAAKRGI
jgi:hypothetical protein